MIRHLEPSPLDEEPLLRRPLLDDGAEEGKAKESSDSFEAAAGRVGEYHMSTKARSVLLQFQDQIVRVSDEEGCAPADGAADDDDGRRLKTTTFVYGACGLRSFGHSLFWRFWAGLFRLIYAYYFFNWTIIYGGLAICSLISVSYEAWATGQPLGTASIVVAMLPVLNLLWVFFGFLYHVLFLGVFNDFYDLDAALFALRARLSSLGARNGLTVLVTLLVNGPVLFSLVVFCVQVAQPVSDSLWTAQFYMSFLCNVLMACLFFTGAIVGVDHPPVAELSPAAAAAAASEEEAPFWCCRCVPAFARRGLHAFVHSEIFAAVRIYVKSSFQGGGVFSGGHSTWGKYATDAFMPIPVDLEGTPAMDQIYNQEESSSKSRSRSRSRAKSHKKKEHQTEDDDDDDDGTDGSSNGGNAGVLLQRLNVEGRGVKPWPTPWFAGWYLRFYCGGSREGSFCRSKWMPCCVALPWTILLGTLLCVLAAVAFSIRAYLLMGFVIFYFMFLPLFYHGLARSIRKSFLGLLVVDVILILVFITAFFLSLSVASYYLGWPVLLVILAANLLTLAAHVPAIRDRRLPPPQDLRKGLAFHSRLMTHRIITTARAWSFASILLVLVLILVMRTVPANYADNGGGGTGSNSSSGYDGYSSPLYQRQWPPPPVAPSSAGGSGSGLVGATTTTTSGGGGGPGLGRNGTASQPPQPYAFCGQTFSRSRLSVLDLAHLSNAAYMTLEEAQDYIGAEITGASRFNITQLALAEEYGPTTYLLDDAASKTLVFAIRGTNEVFDLFQDLDSYSEAMVIQTATSLFPLYANPVFQTILDKFVGTPVHLVEALAWLKDILLNRQKGRHSEETTTTSSGMNTRATRYYYDILSKAIKDEILPDPRYASYQFLLTGHSLGGGIASIVGARIKAIAVTFSAPGVVLSRRKFKIKLRNVQDYVINITPTGDLVPLLDVQSVKAQNIRCSQNRLAYHCHSVLHTIDEIASTCMQGRGVAWGLGGGGSGRGSA